MDRNGEDLMPRARRRNFVHDGAPKRKPIVPMREIRAIRVKFRGFTFIRSFEKTAFLVV
jgi:hypothetical protein